MELAAVVVESAALEALAVVEAEEVLAVVINKVLTMAEVAVDVVGFGTIQFS